jgi:hypothetical protein
MADGADQRFGGVRTEARSREAAPARRPPTPEKVPVQVSQRGTELGVKIRPSNEFTVEEQRVQLCAMAGPMRIFAGRIFLVNLSGATKFAAKIADGKNSPVFIQVEPGSSTLGSKRVTFTEGVAGRQRSSVSLVMPDEGPFQCVLMPDESLYANIDPVEGAAAYQLKCYEVRP